LLTVQQLEIFQSLWAMTQRPRDGVEMPLPQQFEKIAAAGFDGVDIVFGDHDEHLLASLLQAHRLACTLTAFPDSVDSLQPALEMAQLLGVRQLNIIGQIYPFDVERGADTVRAWMSMCEQAAVTMTIETHRDCLTTDMHYTLQLMQAVPEMLVCADLSHYVVGREFGWPISPLVQSQVESILDRSYSFQGRIASREQIQLQISFDHHKQWFDLFADWWAYGFKSWKARNDDDARLNFLCELGPREYAMTAADGMELSDRWQEALMIKSRVEEIWRGL
jgi:hypothetical protein